MRLAPTALVTQTPVSSTIVNDVGRNAKDVKPLGEGARPKSQVVQMSELI